LLPSAVLMLLVAATLISKQHSTLSSTMPHGQCDCRSGFEGPWTFSPTTLTNDYYKLLFGEKYACRLFIHTED
jgi:catalase (peroxidase I)